MAESASVTTRDLSRHAASVLDRVEHGERLTITRDGEAIAEIIPIGRATRTMARWVRDGLIGAPPACGYARAGDVAALSRRLVMPADSMASDALTRMRQDER